MLNIEKKYPLSGALLCWPGHHAVIDGATINALINMMAGQMLVPIQIYSDEYEVTIFGFVTKTYFDTVNDNYANFKKLVCDNCRFTQQRIKTTTFIHNDFRFWLSKAYYL